MRKTISISIKVPVEIEYYEFFDSLIEEGTEIKEILIHGVDFDPNFIRFEIYRKITEKIKEML